MRRSQNQKICLYWQSGRCSHGEKCKFKHSAENSGTEIPLTSEVGEKSKLPSIDGEIVENLANIPVAPVLPEVVLSGMGGNGAPSVLPGNSARNENGRRSSLNNRNDVQPVIRDDADSENATRDLPPGLQSAGITERHDHPSGNMILNIPHHNVARVCRYWNGSGGCNRGNNCDYRHLSGGQGGRVKQRFEEKGQIAAENRIVNCPLEERTEHYLSAASRRSFQTTSGGPLHYTGSSYIDHSLRETSYDNYENHGYHASGQGIINHQVMNYQYSPLEELRKHCSPSAAFDSAARFDPPRCAESTRLGIIRIIEEWIYNDVIDGDKPMPSSLFWLRGGAGAGKSALAQSLSEKFQEKKQLAASFFFFRSDTTRNNGDHLIPTLVWQFVCAFQDVSPFVEDSILGNLDLFTKIYQIQIQKLLIEPLLALKSKGDLITHPRLVVIDGLDECRNSDIQCMLLRVIARAIPLIPYPLRFLVTSRPESHITHVFDHDPTFRAIRVSNYNLSDDLDRDMDIRKFIEEKFVQIREVHRLGRHLPQTWPDPKAISSLVERSSGHFIYASTVIKYIQSPKHRPDDRLEVILRLRPPQKGDRPYALLDALYAVIFAGVEDHGQLEKICLVLGILYLQSECVGIFGTLPDLDNILDLRPGDLDLLFDPILSIVAVYDKTVRILHKSLFDYLLDPTRCGDLPFDLARLHELAATYILKEMITPHACNLFHFQLFAYHCQHAYLNDRLREYLHNLEIPYPRSLLTTSKPSYDELIECLQLITRPFLNTLRREDFDPTGQVYDRHAAAWIDYVDSTIPRSSEPVSKVGGKKWLSKDNAQTIVDDPLLQKADKLKSQLHELLIECRPRNL